MANYLAIEFEAVSKPALLKEFERLFDSHTAKGETNYRDGRLFANIIDRHGEKLVQEIKTITAKFPEEEFRGYLRFEHENYQKTYIYKVQNGRSELVETVSDYYLEDYDLRFVPEPALPLLQQGLDILKRLDTDRKLENKVTIEVENDTHKMIVRKQGAAYWPEKVFVKRMVTEWIDESETPFYP